MLLFFFQRCTEFIDKILELLFCDENTKLSRLYNIKNQGWTVLARPAVTEEGVMYIFDYNNKIIRDTLYYIKNKKDKKLLSTIVKVIGDILLEELGERELMENFINPVIIEIPTSSKQNNKRGFNPSEILAKELASILRIPYIKNVLIKIKDTKPQKTLSRKDRLNNVKNSMELDKKMNHQLKNKSVIIIDDIITTGATLKEAKRALAGGGIKKVMCVAVAH